MYQSIQLSLFLKRSIYNYAIKNSSPEYEINKQERNKISPARVTLIIIIIPKLISTWRYKIFMLISLSDLSFDKVKTSSSCRLFDPKSWLIRQFSKDFTCSTNGFSFTHVCHKTPWSEVRSTVCCVTTRDEFRFPFYRKASNEPVGPSSSSSRLFTVKLQARLGQPTVHVHVHAGIPS